MLLQKRDQMEVLFVHEKCNPNRDILMRTSRDSHGSVLAEGTVGVMLIIMFLVVCIFLMVNGMLLVSYKQRIGMVANAAATQAARCNPFLAPATEIPKHSDAVKSFINNHLQALGLPACSNFALTADNATAKIAFTVEGLKLIGPVGILPTEITMKEKVSAIVQCNRAPGYMAHVMGHFPSNVPGVTYYMPPGQDGTGITYAYFPFYGEAGRSTNLPAIAGGAQPAPSTHHNRVVAEFRTFPGAAPKQAQILYWQNPYGIVCNDNNGWPGGYSAVNGGASLVH